MNLLHYSYLQFDHTRLRRNKNLQEYHRLLKSIDQSEKQSHTMLIMQTVEPLIQQMQNLALPDSVRYHRKLTLKTFDYLLQVQMIPIAPDLVKYHTLLLGFSLNHLRHIRTYKMCILIQKSLFLFFVCLYYNNNGNRKKIYC